MADYVPHGPDEQEQILRVIGAESPRQLFAEIISPPLLRDAPLPLPPGRAEQEVVAELSALAARGEAIGPERSFLGAGMYPHYRPAAVSELALRGEFLTAYTPYQPEVSQGTLQVMFEFQTLISQLTGLPAANASLYDGASALAEAVLMIERLGRRRPGAAARPRRTVLVPRSVHPYYVRVLRTYLTALDLEVLDLPWAANGRVDPAALGAALPEALCVVVQSPNVFGVVEDLAAIGAAASAGGVFKVAVVTDAIALGLLAPPGAFGFDVVVGEAQAFGVPTSLGGPALGFFATRDEHLRQIPGRLAGLTRDLDGRRAFCLTLSTREQHIRRERATSNICTNQGLVMLHATIYLALLGRHGLRDLAATCLRRTAYARRLAIEAGLRPVFDGPTFHEFAARVPGGRAVELRRRALAAGYLAGVPLGDLGYPELSDALLFCFTEMHGRASIESFFAELPRWLS